MDPSTGDCNPICVRMACGGTHSVVVTERLECVAWGGNYHGQVGDGSRQDQKRPQTIIKDGIVACAAGKAHSLAVTSSGEVYAWGNNEDCLLGSGWKSKQETPVKIQIDGHVKAVSAGCKHSLALTEAGEVWAWGANEYGQLGDGTRTVRRIPVKIIGGNVTAVACGWYHNLAITDTGDVWTWGFTCQEPHSGIQHVLSPMLIINGGIKAVAAGSTHCLALTEDGDVLAWGGNDFGQLGDGTMTRRITPVMVAMNCIMIAAGSYHSLALDANCNVLTWGFCMDHTPRGDGTWNNEFTPLKVFLEGGAFAIAAGGVHSMAFTHKGGLFVWGGNSCGQIGGGSLDADQKTPVQVLPNGTMETVPQDEIIRRMMNGPTEMGQRSLSKIGRDNHRAKYADKVVTPFRHSDHGVPELLQKASGQPPTKQHGSLGATYPLLFRGDKRPLGKAASQSTGSLGFVPGTGFKAGTTGNSLRTITWPDGPGTRNGNHRRNEWAQEKFERTASKSGRPAVLALGAGAPETPTLRRVGSKRLSTGGFTDPNWHQKDWHKGQKLLALTG